jgi:hypothetical protein
MSLLNAGRLLVLRHSRGLAPVATLCAAFLLLGVADASAAAVRYAAPGGNEEAGSECLQAHPCSLFNAASSFAPNTKLTRGDEVVIEPGTYSGLARDLGPEGVVILPGNISIHGVAGQPRPVIDVDVGTPGTVAFFMSEPGDVLSRVETVSTGQRSGFALVSSGVVDGVVARTSGNDAPCSASDGVVRNSACLSTGDFGSALSINGSPARLRNVTAIATGVGSRGLLVTAQVGELNVEAIGLLARGKGGDVFAGASSFPPNPGAKVTINLDHSDFADIETENEGGGTATVTAPGSGSNIKDEPLLAADGYHELLGSPTIGHGATDAFSGTTDIDGESRVFGLADIGADELQIEPTVPPSPAPAKPPNTTLRKKPARKTAARQATFTFVSDQAPSRFECKLDKRAFKPCRSPFKLKKLKPGHHSFQVRAVNGAGVADPTPAVFRWKVS